MYHMYNDPRIYPTKTQGSSKMTPDHCLTDHEIQIDPSKWPPLHVDFCHPCGKISGDPRRTSNKKNTKHPTDVSQSKNKQKNTRAGRYFFSLLESTSCFLFEMGFLFKRGFPIPNLFCSHRCKVWPIFGKFIEKIPSPGRYEKWPHAFPTIYRGHKWLLLGPPCTYLYCVRVRNW